MWHEAVEPARVGHVAHVLAHPVVDAPELLFGRGCTSNDFGQQGAVRAREGGLRFGAQPLIVPADVVGWCDGVDRAAPFTGLGPDHHVHIIEAAEVLQRLGVRQVGEGDRGPARTPCDRGTEALPREEELEVHLYARGVFDRDLVASNAVQIHDPDKGHSPDVVVGLPVVPGDGLTDIHALEFDQVEVVVVEQDARPLNRYLLDVIRGERGPVLLCLQILDLRVEALVDRVGHLLGGASGLVLDRDLCGPNEDPAALLLGQGEGLLTAVVHVREVLGLWPGWRVFLGRA